MEKEEFKELVRYYSFSVNERNAILSLIDNISKITLPENTDIKLLMDIKTAYDTLKNNELLKDFARILKDERKIAQFKMGLYKATLIKEHKCDSSIE